MGSRLETDSTPQPKCAFLFVLAARRTLVDTDISFYLFHVQSGPLISPAAKERVETLIQSCADQGGKIALDGRGVKVDGYPKGNFVGPTILEATTDMDCYQ